MTVHRDARKWNITLIWDCSCERENRWLDEAPYYVDTTVVPRGGGRRRKSMEPRALANLNGMLVPTPGRSSNNGHCSTAPSTPIRRRESVQWMRTPPEKTGYGLDADEEANDSEWDDAGLLIPVPPTPAPEAIASYVDNMSVPETPTTQLDDSRSELMVRTCPPKQYKSEYAELGEGILAREKDERVLMRLMAARRKSLQFAPKVASPLSKSWD